MKRERGQAIILALVVLAVGSLVIVPTLNYASTGLKSYQVTRELMLEQYSADAAIEDAIWRLQNNIDGITDSLTVATPTQSYSITVNGNEVMITVGLPSPSPPDTILEKHALLQFKLDRDPRWIKMGEVVTYTFTLTNKHKQKTLEISYVGALLPPGFEYVDGSSSGMTTDDPDITYEDGSQKLWWLFDPPYLLEAEQSASQIFEATANVDGGIYYAKGGANYRAPGLDWEPFDTGPDAPVWVSMYYIAATAGKVTLETCVALTQSGGATVFNWQEQ